MARGRTPARRDRGVADAQPRQAETAYSRIGESDRDRGVIRRTVLVVIGDGKADRRPGCVIELNCRLAESLSWRWFIQTRRQLATRPISCRVQAEDDAEGPFYREGFARFRSSFRAPPGTSGSDFHADRAERYGACEDLI